MKMVWLVGILLLTQAVSQAGDTAYQALHIIGKDNKDFLNHVVEVRGTMGQPQPVTWTILVDDQSARGGVREFEVSKGKVVSEHTPMHAYAGASTVMDLKHLNLDSQGAFTIANQEAVKRNVGFDSVDFLLRGDEQTGAPEWVLRLIDVNHVLVGTITIAADNGAVLGTTGFGAPQNAIASAPPPPGNVVPPPGNAAPPPGTAPIPPPNGDEPPDDQPRYGVGHQINKGLHRLGADLQQFFTGKRTWDQKFQDEP